LVDTVLFHVNAVTGEDARGVTADDDVLEGLDIIQEPAIDSYLLRNGIRMVVRVPLGTILVCRLTSTLLIWPFDPYSPSQLLLSHFPSTQTPMPASDASQGIKTLSIQISANVSLLTRHGTISLPPGEDLRTLILATRGPITSFGKVLGTRETLYKYLIPRLFSMLIVPRVESLGADDDHGNWAEVGCGLYVVDSMKGTVIYRVVVPPVGGACDVKATMVDNWLVYHYYEADATAVGRLEGV
jgi:hypothetical protein